MKVFSKAVCCQSQGLDVLVRNFGEEVNQFLADICNHFFCISGEKNCLSDIAYLKINDFVV